MPEEIQKIINHIYHSGAADVEQVNKLVSYIEKLIQEVKDK